MKKDDRDILVSSIDKVRGMNTFSACKHIDRVRTFFLSGKEEGEGILLSV